MKKKNNMVLKLSNFRKHIKICLVFLTLLTVLNLTVSGFVLFFHFKGYKQLSAKQIFEQSLNSIVEIKAVSEEIGESYGTAEFINNNGRLITNAHVVTYSSMNIINTFDSYYIRFATDEEYIEVSLMIKMKLMQ